MLTPADLVEAELSLHGVPEGGRREMAERIVKRIRRDMGIPLDEVWQGAKDEEPIFPFGYEVPRHGHGRGEIEARRADDERHGGVDVVDFAAIARSAVSSGEGLSAMALDVLAKASGASWAACGNQRHDHRRVAKWQR